MDINKAVRYVTEDKTWLSKLLIGVLMSVLSFLIVPALILQGYVVKIIRRVMSGQWDGLPEWDDWGKLLRDGFFVTVAEIVYTLPFILLIIVGAAATGGLTSVTGSENAAGLIATTGVLGVLLQRKRRDHFYGCAKCYRGGTLAIWRVDNSGRNC